MITKERTSCLRVEENLKLSLIDMFSLEREVILYSDICMKTLATRNIHRAMETRIMHLVNYIEVSGETVLLMTRVLTIKERSEV
jgi:hypothetical protein